MPQLLGRLEGGLVGRQALPDGAGLLGPQVQGHVLLGLVELTQVLLLLLGHDDVDPGDGLADDADLGKFGGSATGHLGVRQVMSPGIQTSQVFCEIRT